MSTTGYNAGNGGTGHASGLRALDERLLTLRREGEELLATLDDARNDLESVLRAQMQERPYAVLAAAAALGYVAGGGLASRLTRLLFLLGSRVGFEVLSRQALQ